MNHASHRWLAALVLIGAAAIPARADDAPAIEVRVTELMKQMSQYTGALERFRITVDTSQDEMDGGQLVQVSETKTIAVQRPNHVVCEVQGDGVHRRTWFDGKVLTMCDLLQKVHASRELPGSIAEMLDRAERKLGHSLPMADLLRPDIYAAMMARVVSGRYLGLHRVSDKRCHHLAFRQDEIDWQIWIDEGDKPLARKLVITYKLEPGNPQYTALIRSWDTDLTLAPEVFRPEIPAGSEQIDIRPVPESDDATPPAKEVR